MTGRNHSGFTLVELLISIAILGAITASLGQAVVIGLRTTDATSTRMSLSHDAQLASAYFVTDVQTSDDVPSTTPCDLAGSTVLFRLHWTPRANPPLEVLADKYASYALVLPGGGITEKRIVRQTCQAGSPAVTGLVVAHHLDTSTPAVTCFSAAGGSTPCTGQPAAIRMTVSEAGTQEAGQVVSYAFALKATRRSTP